jgi:hypothetical protein
MAMTTDREIVGAFEHLERVVASIRAAIRAAEQAEETAKKVRYECGLMKVAIPTDYHSRQTERQPHQKAVELAMVTVREAETHRLVEEAHSRALAQAAFIIENKRLELGHRLTPAVVELGGIAGAYRSTYLLRVRAEYDHHDRTGEQK